VSAVARRTAPPDLDLALREMVEARIKAERDHLLTVRALAAASTDVARESARRHERTARGHVGIAREALSLAIAQEAEARA
jgi:hypothetical protein